MELKTKLWIYKIACVLSFGVALIAYLTTAKRFAPTETDWPLYLFISNAVCFWIIGRLNPDLELRIGKKPKDELDNPNNSNKK